MELASSCENDDVKIRTVTITNIYSESEEGIELSALDNEFPIGISISSADIAKCGLKGQLKIGVRIKFELVNGVLLRNFELV